MGRRVFDIGGPLSSTRPSRLAERLLHRGSGTEKDAWQQREMGGIMACVPHTWFSPPLPSMVTVFSGAEIPLPQYGASLLKQHTHTSFCFMVVAGRLHNHGYSFVQRGGWMDVLHSKHCAVKYGVRQSKIERASSRKCQTCFVACFVFKWRSAPAECPIAGSLVQVRVSGKSLYLPNGRHTFRIVCP